MIPRLARLKLFQEFSKRCCSTTSVPARNFLKSNQDKKCLWHGVSKSFCSGPPGPEFPNLTPHQEVKNYINKYEPSQYHDHLIEKKVEELLSFGVDSEVICEELCQLPASSIFRVPYEQLELVFSGLSTHEFDPDDCFRIINYCSDLYHSEMEVILDRMMYLVEISPRKVDFTRHVPKSPYLLTMDPNSLRHIVRNLSAKFPGPELRHLVDKNPDILANPWPDTARKIFYIFEEMGLDQPHMAYNRSLGQTFPTIRNRHQLLKRLGKYTLPKMHKDRLSYLQNPRLEKIMDSGEEAFLQHIAGVTAEEYYVFEFMMGEEFKETLDGVPLDVYDEEEEEERLEAEKMFELYGTMPRKGRKFKGYYIGPKDWELQ